MFSKSSAHTVSHGVRKPADVARIVYFDGARPASPSEIAARRRTGTDNAVWVDASSRAESASGNGLSSKDVLANLDVCRADEQLVVGARTFALLRHALPRQTSSTTKAL